MGELLQNSILLYFNNMVENEVKGRRKVRKKREKKSEKLRKNAEAK